MKRDKKQRPIVKISHAKIVRAVVGSAQLVGYTGTPETFEKALEARAKTSRHQNDTINQNPLEQPVQHNRQSAR
jgi:hypothetical protein